MSVGATESQVLLGTNRRSLATPARDVMVRWWRWVWSQVNGLAARQRTRRLRVSETISLGEKRFVSILEVDGEQLLIGGSAENLVLLAKLEGLNRNLPEPAAEPLFADALSRASTPAFDPLAARSTNLVKESRA